MNDADLVRMANQIAKFFELYPEDEAMNGIAKHIHNSWEPRMRGAMKLIIDTGSHGLDPLCAEALRIYFKGPKSNERRASVNPREVAPDGGDPSFAEGGGDAG